ncbi:MAG: DUF3408 domain-containing protein [Chryseobacterium culicis]
MISENNDDEFEKPIVDEDYLMNVISGDQFPKPSNGSRKDQPAVNKQKEKARNVSTKKVEYEEYFLINKFPSGRTGKVVYIRPEYHERLLRIVQLTREEKITLYSYIDNILEHHFQEYGDDITNYFNKHFKPIL